MKTIIILLILTVSTCKSGKTTTTPQHKNDLLLQYSKGPCLGKCPVYDLYIYKDGTVSFRGVDNVIQKRVIKSYLSPHILKDIMDTLRKESDDFEPTIKIRDLPITTLRYGNKEYKYHTSRVNGKLKELNSKIEEIVEQIVQ